MASNIDRYDVMRSRDIHVKCVRRKVTSSCSSVNLFYETAYFYYRLGLVMTPAYLFCTAISAISIDISNVYSKIFCGTEFSRKASNRISVFNFYESVEV